MPKHTSKRVLLDPLFAQTRPLCFCHFCIQVILYRHLKCWKFNGYSITFEHWQICLHSYSSYSHPSNPSHPSHPSIPLIPVTLVISVTPVIPAIPVLQVIPIILLILFIPVIPDTLVMYLITLGIVVTPVLLLFPSQSPLSSHPSNTIHSTDPSHASHPTYPNHPSHPR